MSNKWQPLDNGSTSSVPNSPQPERERFSLVDDGPRTPTPNDQFLHDRAPSRTMSTASFVSSPLNPRAPMSPSPMSPSLMSASPFPSAAGSFPRTPRGSQHFSRMVSEDGAMLASPASPFASLSAGSRGSMVLYRLATEDEAGALLPPKFNPASAANRDSVASSSGDSVFSLSSDSKYPSGMGLGYGQRGMVPYAYDPAIDDKEPPDEEDLLHDPLQREAKGTGFALRGFLNVGVLILLIVALLALFLIYPVVTFVRTNARNLAIDGNIRINGTGQAPVLCVLP